MRYAKRSHRHRHAEHRRELLRRFVFPVASLLVVITAFIFGFAWQSQQQARGGVPRAAPDRAVDLQARATALELLDEGLRAQREGRVNGALSALDRARRTDPSLPGVDASFAAIALNEKQFAEMRAAATAAAAIGDHAAAANVLLGMGNWIERGPSDREMASAADAASVRFADATEADYFHAPAWFFWGEVLRFAGRERDGYLRALAALHRFDPWESADFLTAKIVFASAEGGASSFVGVGVDGGSPWVQAIADSLRDARPNAASLPATPPLYAARGTTAALSSDSLFLVGRRVAPRVP